MPAALGIYTRWAIKPFPYHGPTRIEVEGLFQDMRLETPQNWKVYDCIFPSFEAYAGAAYAIADAKIGLMPCKHSIGANLAAMTPRLLRRIAAKRSLINSLNAMEHMFQFIIGAHSPPELACQEAVLDPRGTGDGSFHVSQEDSSPRREGE